MITILQCPYRSIVVENSEGEPVVISQGNNIVFATENGEMKQGEVTGFKGAKEEKVEIEIQPKGKEYKEIWPVAVMSEGSLVLDEDDQDDGE